MSEPIVPSPPASQTAAARAGRAVIAMPALTIGVVSPKVRVTDVENIIWILNTSGETISDPKALFDLAQNQDAAIR